MSRLARLDPGAIAPVTDRPAPDRVLAGDPVFTTWNIEERDGLFCGIWQATPGKWRIAYDEWEYCRILSGVSVITEDDGAALTLRAGDSFVIRPGFRGTWEVLETTRKDYVIRLWDQSAEASKGSAAGDPGTGGNRPGG
jgi:uncharacterized cupin superfamily protein